MFFFSVYWHFYYKWLHSEITFCPNWVFYQLCLLFHRVFSKCSEFRWFFFRLPRSCKYIKLCRFLNRKSWPVGFLNFENFTSHFLKNPKISLVFLIGLFLIGTDWVYAFFQKIHNCTDLFLSWAGFAPTLYFMK